MSHRVSAIVRIASDNPGSIVVGYQAKSVEMHMDMLTTEEEFLEFCKSAWLAYVGETDGS